MTLLHGHKGNLAEAKRWEKRKEVRQRLSCASSLRKWTNVPSRHPRSRLHQSYCERRAVHHSAAILIICPPMWLSFCCRHLKSVLLSPFIVSSHTWYLITAGSPRTPCHLLHWMTDSFQNLPKWILWLPPSLYFKSEFRTSQTCPPHLEKNHLLFMHTVVSGKNIFLP